MKKYVLIDILPFLSGMSIGKIKRKNKKRKNKMYIVSPFLVQKACSVGLYTHVPKGRCATRLRYRYTSMFVVA
jgi:hypothetical protein